MRNRVFLTSCLFTILVFISGVAATSVSADTSHCGTISSDETWSSAGNVHIVTCNVTVASGVTLTITEGTIVKFSSGTALIVNGSLRVLGTTGAPVYFTSYRDDTIGGDTNGDGSATTPAPGDWTRIEFQDNSDDATSLINYAIIRYGGDYYGGQYYGTVTLVSASPTVQNTTIEQSQYYAIRANTESFPTLTNNTLADNGINGLALQGGTVSSDATWNVTDTPYYLISTISIASGTALTVTSNVVVKVSYAHGLLVGGSLRVLGTTGAPVYFTSYRDDTIGGDTNGDGSATTPAPGDWTRIEFQDNSDDATSLINYAIIRYGGDYYGGQYYGTVTLVSASPTVQNTTIEQSQYYAIRANTESFPTLTNNTLADNGINGLALQGGTVSSDATWNVTDTPYYLISTISIASGTALTVTSNVVVKVSYAHGLLVGGSLRVLGTTGAPVYFTSYRDDTIGGDTNGDGSLSTPAPGDWTRIEFQDNSDDATSLINYAIIRYGGDYYGGQYYGTVTLVSASPTVQNTTIEQSQYYAIRANTESFPTLTNNTLADNGINGLALQGGTVSNNATWDVTDTSYYLISTISIAPGTTLTVTSDAVVKVSYAHGLLVGGSLRVLGTTGAPVYFTSYRDDTIGGDTNGDGSLSTPAPGDWTRIEFQDNSDDATSLIDHAVIRYGGDYYGGQYYGTVTLVSASPTVQNTTIEQSQYYAIRANTESFPTLTNNTLADNGINGLALQGGTVSNNATWDVTDTSYYLISTISIAPGTTLTVTSDAVVKVSYAHGLLVGGSLRVLGTTGAPVYFTSYRDDTIGGDTNGDGSLSTPAPGDWTRIEFQDNSDDATSLIDHAVIRYGGDYYGGQYYGTVTLVSASPTVQNTTIEQSQYYAIRANTESFPTLTNNTLADNGINGLALQGGTVSNNATWDVTDTSYYLISTISIAPGTTLTVTSDAVVKVSYAHGLLVGGSLRVLGTTGAPVYFTSYRDDTIGGDTNGDGSLSTPAPGDWTRIEFQDNSDDATSLIDHAVIRYGGDYYGGQYYGTVTLVSASPTVQNTTIEQSQYYAIRANTESFPTLTNNTLADNGINGLALQGGTVSNNATWDVTDTSYYLISTISIAPGTTLTVTSDAVVKVSYVHGLLVGGSLRVLGTTGNPVYFTSYRDDTIGGDTNGDGSLSTPVPGDWTRIEFQDNSDDATSLIDHAVIRYGGDYYDGERYGAITLVSASPTVQNTTIEQSQYYGIYTYASRPTLGCNNIHDNGAYGLYNATTGIAVDAEHQWWGSTNGPYHPTTNPGGSGNAVTDGVDYRPWRSTPCGMVLHMVFLPIVMR